MPIKALKWKHNATLRPYNYTVCISEAYSQMNTQQQIFNNFWSYFVYLLKYGLIIINEKVLIVLYNVI